MKQGRHSEEDISCNFEHDHPCWLAAILTVLARSDTEV